MGLSLYALERAGFRRRRDDEDLSASFTCVYAFGVEGLCTETGLLVPQDGAIEGVPYRLAIAESLNAGCRVVADDDFADDELAWMKEHKCPPPYLLIHIGPTTVHKMTGNFLKEGPFGLQTYDAFIPARSELRELEAKVMPRLLSSLNSIFSGIQQPLRFKQLERAVTGRTSAGVTVFDFGLEVRAELSVRRRIAASDIAVALQQSVDLASRMRPQVADLYYHALSEEDPLKRFLFLFLTIERQTHATFKSIDHGAQMNSLTRVAERVKATSASFLGGQPERWKTLQDRFVWCVLTAWTHLTDEDVENFAKVKKVRDQIAHGEITSPPGDALVLVERVAAQVQRCP